MKLKKPNIKLRKPHRPEWLSIKYIKETAKKKNFRIGTYTTAMTAIVIGIAVVANMCVQALPTKYTLLDTTSSGLYSISEETESTVEAVEQDVKVYLIAQDGQEDSTLLQLIENYCEMNNKIEYELVDPVERPYFTSSYTDDAVYNNSIIVESGEKSRYISYYDIYETNYEYTDSGYTSSTSFNGEGLLTSAIDYVTGDSATKLYLLDGHGEVSLSSGFENEIAAENMDYEYLNLLTADGIPSDCDCLIINSPTSDISNSEMKTIKEYLNAGGNILLFTDCETGNLENLEDMMAEYGLSRVDGMIVEGNSNYYVQGYPNYLLPELESHEITNPLMESYYILMPIAQGLEIDDEARESEDLNIEVLLRTTSSAYSKADGVNAESAELEDGDIETDEGFPVAVAVTKTLEADDTEAKVVWYTSTYIQNSQMDELVSGANTSIFANTLGWLCDAEESITVHAKAIDSEYLSLSTAQAARWSIVLVVLIPGIFAVCGIRVWLKRRKK